MNRHDGRWGKKKYPWEDFPNEIRAFQSMQARVLKRHITTTVWARTTDGFYEFLACIGPWPTDMKQPSPGRKDHSKGYEPGNVFWQEWEENRLDGCRSGGLSKNRNTKHSAETKLKMSIAALKDRDKRSEAGKLGGAASAINKRNRMNKLDG